MLWSLCDQTIFRKGKQVVAQRPEAVTSRKDQRGRKHELTTKGTSSQRAAQEDCPKHMTISCDITRPEAAMRMKRHRKIGENPRVQEHLDVKTRVYKPRFLSRKGVRIEFTFNSVRNLRPR